MKTKLALLAIVVLVSLIQIARGLAATSSRYAASPSSQTSQTSLQYHFDYTCNGERVMVASCRKDSDMAGYPPTQPADDYCQIYYPDRPKRNGFAVMAIELRGDVIKKLQMCGAFKTSSPAAEVNVPVTAAQNAGTAPVRKQQGSGSAGRTWEYLVVGAYNEPSQNQQVLNQYGTQGWELVVRGGDYYYFKHAR